MQKILISACLVGDKTRYDGRGSYHPLVSKLLEKYELVPFCPEVEGGLKIPRAKAEIVKTKVLSEKGKDVTKEFDLGSKKALEIIKYLNVKIAILKDFSPSCGVTKIYDGTFSGRLIDGQGILTRKLQDLGVKVYTPEEFADLI